MLYSKAVWLVAPGKLESTLQVALVLKRSLMICLSRKNQNLPGAVILSPIWSSQRSPRWTHRGQTSLPRGRHGTRIPSCVLEPPPHRHRPATSYTPTSIHHPRLYLCILLHFQTRTFLLALAMARPL